MKRIKRILLLILLVMTCCSCAFKKNVIRNGKGEVVIEYISYSAVADKKDRNVNYIRIYDDKTISTGTNEKMREKYDLSTDEYQKIINYAFSKSFVKLKEDLSNNKVKDGTTKFVTLYYEDGTSKKYGGNNPNNRKFKKLVNMLYDVIEEKEKE